MYNINNFNLLLVIIMYGRRVLNFDCKKNLLKKLVNLNFEI